MAFLYIDDDAFAGPTSDAPHASWAGVQMQRNWKAVHDERFQKIGWMAAGTDLPRLCSIYPVAWGPFWCYVAPNEQVESLTVYVRTEAVTWTNGVTKGAGVDAIRLAVTAGDALGHTNMPESFISDPRWQLLDTNTSEEDVTFTVPLYADVGGDTDARWKGWVAVYLWTWSVPDTTAEASGTLDDGTSLFGAIAVSSLTIGATTNPPERAIAIAPQTANNTGSVEAGPWRQLCYFEENGQSAGVDVLFPAPPLAGNDTVYTGQAGINIYSMGVLVLQGITIEINPRTDYAPAEEGFYSEEPVRWQSHQVLARSAEQLTANRVPSWLCAPSLVRDDESDTAEDRKFWRMFSAFTQANPTTFGTSSGSPSTLAATFVANPPPTSDANGFRAVVSLYGTFPDDSGHVVDIYVRIAAYTVAGASIVNGTFIGHSVQLRPSWSASWDTPWVPLSQSANMGNYKDGWQFRGALIGNGTGVVSDISRVHHLFCEIDETSLTYPCVLKLEGYVDPATVIGGTGGISNGLQIAIISAGIASRGFDD